MKKLAIIPLMLFSLYSWSQQKTIPPTGNKERIVDMEDYRFEIDLNDQDDTIKGLATLHFRLLKDAGNFIIDLVSKRADGRGMKVGSVTANGHALSFSHSNDQLRISFQDKTAENKAGQEKTISIQYSGIPADGLIISRNKFKQRTFFSDNWPNRAHNWLPCIDHPSDKAAVDFIVKAPVHYQVVSNGIQLEETNLPDNTKLTHWHEPVDLPMKVMGIGVAEFAVNYVGDAGGVPVSTWVYPQDREKGFYDFAMAKDILPFFTRNIAPFPYKKLANVEAKTIFGGMENAGEIFYSESSLTGTREQEELIAHEIAHQWFGDMATETDWQHVWLSEGFATYFSLLYLEDKYGIDTLKKSLINDRKKVIEFSRKRMTPVVDTVTTEYMKLLNPNSYEKGGWVLHMLRRQLSDSVFWKGIRAYYSKYAGHNASTDDFRKVMEDISGKDLKQFFTQWLYTSGHPVLNITSKYDDEKKQVLIMVIQRQDILFQFPLVVQLEGGPEDGTMYKSTVIKDKQTVIAIPMSAAPGSVTIDPNVQLLYEESGN